MRVNIVRSIRVFYHSAFIESSSNGVARGSVSNNYASLECGAKVISTNNEASVSPNTPRAVARDGYYVYVLLRTLRLSYKRTEIFTC